MKKKIKEIIIRNNAQQIANCLLPKNEEESELIKIFNETLKCINKALEELLKEPTLDECIKEWEDRGWKVEISTSTIKLDYIKFGRLSGIHIYKGRKEVRILYENLHYEEFHLLSKTIKACEVEE